MGVSRFLLDTHTFVWAVSAPERLGPEAHRALSNPKSELVVSAVSSWELAIKVRSGRFAEAATLVRDFDRACRELGAQQLAITAAHCIRAGGMEWEHRDPFDRLLAAQGLIEGLALVTRDAAFGNVVDLDTVW